MPRRLPDDVRVAPSILSADFASLREQVREVLDAGARVIHVDVMDGHFVPPITIGPLIVASLREQVADAGGHLDVHLMIEHPERQVAEFAKAGADSITFHVEATPHADRVLDLIAEHGVSAGIALNPGTAVSAVSDIAVVADVLLCMTVNPGWGGQPFIASSPSKIERLATLCADGAALEVDGGIDATTAPFCRAAGARMFVAGSAIFGAPSPGEAYLEIARAVDAS